MNYTFCKYCFQVEEQKMVVQFELENLEFRPDPEPALTDLVHAVSVFISKRSIHMHFYSESCKPHTTIPTGSNISV